MSGMQVFHYGGGKAACGHWLSGAETRETEEMTAGDAEGCRGMEYREAERALHFLCLVPTSAIPGVPCGRSSSRPEASRDSGRTDTWTFQFSRSGLSWENQVF